MEYPPLAELVKDKWPSDVIERAKELQAEIGSIGAYSHSKGVPLIRKHVAKFIEGASSYYVLRLADAHVPIPPQSAMAIPPTPKTSSSLQAPRPA